MVIVVVLSKNLVGRVVMVLVACNSDGMIDLAVIGSIALLSMRWFHLDPSRIEYRRVSSCKFLLIRPSGDILSLSLS